MNFFTKKQEVENQSKDISLDFKQKNVHKILLQEQYKKKAPQNKSEHLRGVIVQPMNLHTWNICFCSVIAPSCSTEVNNSLAPSLCV